MEYIDRMLKLNPLHQLFIRDHEAQIDANDFDSIYEDAYAYFKDNKDIGALTDAFISVGIVPHNHFTSRIPMAYAYGSELIHAIHIPTNIRSIGGEAFSNSKLSFLTFDPDCDIKRICSYAFNNTPLKEVKLPNRIITISNYAFADCKELKSIFLPDDIKTISPSAFAYDWDLVIECTANSNAHYYAKNIAMIKYKIVE